MMASVKLVTSILEGVISQSDGYRQKNGGFCVIVTF